MKYSEIAILICIFFLSYKGTQKVMSTIRGIRNNNLLNIRYNKANNWNGQTGQDDKGFSIFSEPVNSIRAAFKIMLSYRKRGVVTLRQVITEFAPPVENKTENYISYVALKSGVNPNIAMTDTDLIKIMPHMIRMEVGQNVSNDLVNRAWSMI